MKAFAKPVVVAAALPGILAQMEGVYIVHPKMPIAVAVYMAVHASCMDYSSSGDSSWQWSIWLSAAMAVAAAFIMHFFL